MATITNVMVKKLDFYSGKTELMPNAEPTSFINSSSSLLDPLLKSFTQCPQSLTFSTLTLTCFPLTFGSLISWDTTMDGNQQVILVSFLVELIEEI